MRVLTVDFMVSNVIDESHAAGVLRDFMFSSMDFIDTTNAKFGAGVESWTNALGKKGFGFNVIFWDAVMEEYDAIWNHDAAERILKAEKMYNEDQPFGEPIVTVLMFKTEKMQESKSEKMQIGNQ